MKLIDNWKDAWKMASVWIYVAIGAMPDIYNGIAALGWIDQLPGPAMWTIRALAAAGIAARVLKQQALQREGA